MTRRKGVTRMGQNACANFCSCLPLPSFPSRGQSLSSTPPPLRAHVLPSLEPLVACLFGPRCPATPQYMALRADIAAALAAAPPALADAWPLAAAVLYLAHPRHRLAAAAASATVASANSVVVAAAASAAAKAVAAPAEASRRAAPATGATSTGVDGTTKGSARTPEPAPARMSFIQRLAHVARRRSSSGSATPDARTAGPAGAKKGTTSLGEAVPPARAVQGFGVVESPTSGRASKKAPRSDSAKSRNRGGTGAGTIDDADEVASTLSDSASSSSSSSSTSRSAGRRAKKDSRKSAEKAAGKAPKERASRPKEVEEAAAPAAKEPPRRTEHARGSAMLGSFSLESPTAALTGPPRGPRAMHPPVACSCLPN